MFSAPFIVAAALAVQASAQTPPPANIPAATPPTAAAQQPEPVRARRICETRAPTGRRLEQRICYTPEQHAALVEAKRREAEEIVGARSIQNDRGIVGIPFPN